MINHDVFCAIIINDALTSHTFYVSVAKSLILLKNLKVNVNHELY